MLRINKWGFQAAVGLAVVSAAVGAYAINLNGSNSQVMCPSSTNPSHPDGNPPNDNDILAQNTPQQKDCWTGPNFTLGTTWARGKVVVNSNNFTLTANLFGNAGTAAKEARVWGYSGGGFVSQCYASDSNPNGSANGVTKNRDFITECPSVQHFKVVAFNTVLPP